MTVFGQPRFQVLHALQQQGILRHCCLQGVAEMAILGFDGGDAFVLARVTHASMVHLQHKSA